MTPNVDRAMRDFEAAMDEYVAHPNGEVGPLEEWANLKAALAVDAAAREETRAGIELEGFPGCMFRFISQVDYRRVPIWLRGEIIRNMPQACIFDVCAAAVASIVLQLVGSLVRSQMRPAAREIMQRAVQMLEDDIAKLSDDKKTGAILRQGLKIIPGGNDGCS